MWQWIAHFVDASRPYWPLFLGIALWVFLVFAMEIV
jgi:hypothetical protein